MGKKIRGHGPLFLLSSLIVALIVLPSLSLVQSLLGPPGQHWQHIKQYLLADYISNTLILMVAVGLLTAFLGSYLAWTLSHYTFKHKGLYYMLLVLPMAIPPYIGGYIYGGIFSYGGSLEKIMVHYKMTPLHINIRSMTGAIFVFSLFLMPYVVLIAKAFFDKLPSSYYASGQVLGKSKRQIFMKVILPMALSSIIGGTVLVMLEVLNDFGLVSAFGITTFSTAIYKTWFGLGDVSSAIRLASILMVLVVVMLSSEHIIRRKIRVSQARSLAQTPSRHTMTPCARGIFLLVFSSYIFMALILPLAQLLQWTFLAKENLSLGHLPQVIESSLMLALTVTGLVVGAGLIIGNYGRLSQGMVSKIYSRFVVLGYSVPASIIAVAVLTFFIKTDRFLRPLYTALDLKNLFLTSSMVMLTFALTFRFMAIGFNSIESGYKKMGKKYHEASILLGQSSFKTFIKVDLPLLKPALVSACILTYVDVLKELPLTLILRPFNYNTLATQVYTYANDEMIHEASFYALVIVGLSMLALVSLNLIEKRRTT